ncbi:MAG: phosphoglucosamine mutase [Defluviitaleaceae bacterium]|nr:phosphoglucosamine mutase [Defluviitaleaceae bacterium]MCL2263461.1 phosphoglucosamine mutase [Defluviitaleaceae bacterium]
MGKLFGTDGVRGVANTELTPELAFDLGRVGGYVLTRETHHAPKVLIATDSRQSGDMLAAALTAGLCSIGATVYHAGVMPTPAVAHLVRKYNLDAGAMISASHNKMADNGIKFFNNEGFKLPDVLEDEIEALIEKNRAEGDELPRPIGTEVGTVGKSDQAEADYTGFLLSTVKDLRLDGIKIAIDCANGATSYIAPQIFKQLGAELITLHNAPNGQNINDNCGSTHMESLQKCVKEQKADIGIAFDGDGDRMLAICEKGEFIDGDAIMAICALDLNERGKLEKNTVVATVMSNQGFECFCRDNKINMYRADVGDRYVLEKMLSDGYCLGGEQSGHVIFLEHSTTGDGILTALQLLAVLARKKQSLSALAGVIETFPQVLVNATVPNARKPELATNAEIQKAQAEIETALEGEGRILVRPSGTEPVVRVMLEGRDKDKIDGFAKNLASVIEKNLNF